MKIQLSDLQVLMGRMGKAFFLPDGLPASLSATTDLFEADSVYPMPLTKSGVNFEPGAPEVTKETITEGSTWYTFAEKGDDNISLQVPSLHVDLNNLFMTKKGAQVSTKVGSDANAPTFSGQGYSMAIKKVRGAWVFMDREETCMIALPVTDNYASLVGATGEAMGYYNVAVSTLPDKNGADIIIFQKNDANVNADTNE